MCVCVCVGVFVPCRFAAGDARRRLRIAHTYDVHSLTSTIFAVVVRTIKMNSLPLESLIDKISFEAVSVREKSLNSGPVSEQVACVCVWLIQCSVQYS